MGALLEAPYQLSTGLGSVRSICHTGRLSLFAASEKGTFEIDGEGAQTLIFEGPADAVTAHPRTLYVLGRGQIHWGALPDAGQPLVVQGTLPAPGVVDLQAWCDGSVLLAGKDEITAWNPETGETWAWAMDLPDLRAVTLGGGEGCDYALVVAGTSVLAVTPAEKRTLAHDLVSPRAVARDHRGRVWVAAGEDPTLMQVEGGVASIYARFLGQPRDLVAGIGGLLPPANVYIADGEGSVDYVHAP